MGRKSISELSVALINLQSDDLSVQKTGLKKMLSYATQELGGRSLPVREWFLNIKNSDKYFATADWNMSPKILSGLFRCFHFICERMIDHPVMWSDFPKTHEVDEYKGRLRQLALQYMEHPASDVRADVAYCLALLGDGLAWDLYMNIIQKKPSYCGWLEIALTRYGKFSLSGVQKKNLEAVLITVENKSKNSSVKRQARSIIALIAPLEQPLISI